MGRWRERLFVAGLALLLLGVMYVPIALAGQSQVIARAASEGIGFTAAYTHYDFTLPTALLVFGGVAMGAAYGPRRQRQ
jgi:hypothetical protein